MDSGWRSRFPGGGNADLMREQLQWMVQRLDAGEVEEVQRWCVGRAWRSSIDAMGVPMVVLEYVQICVDSAWEALQPPVDAEQARAGLRQAAGKLRR